MLNESSPLAFTIGEPYQAGLKLVRKALEQQGLRTAAELNVSARIKQDLGAGLAPCTVLYIDDPVLLLECVVFDRSAALFIPVPVVVAGTNHHTEVFVRSPEAFRPEALPAAVREPFRALRNRIVRALESIGVLEGVRLLAAL